MISEIEVKSKAVLAIGGFSFDMATRQLRSADGKLVPIRSQSAQVLALLARSAGEVVGKGTLIEAVWDRAFVTDDSLTQCIADIRRALGDGDHSIIQTFPKKGYLLNVGAAEAEKAPARRNKWYMRAAAAAAAAALAVAGILLTQDRTPDRSAAKPAIAVLAFDDLSVGEDKGFLSDAIGEGIITELARFPEFTVIARNSSFKFRGKAVDVREIGEALGVDYVLEGSQQKNGERLRVTVQLVNAHDDGHLWAESFERDLGDLFTVQSEIVRMVASAVGGTLGFRPPPGRNRAGVSALLYSLRGRKAIAAQFSRENNEIVGRMGRKAIEADPTSPFGYISLALHYRNGFVFGWTDLDKDEAQRRAENYAEKALELDADNYFAHFARARIHVNIGEMDQAIARLQRATELNPSASHVFTASAEPLLYTGRTDEAIAAIEQAMRIDPLFPQWYHWQMGWALWEKQDCDAALASMQKMAKVPVAAHPMLAAIYACLGMQDDARATMAKYREKNPDVTIAEHVEKFGPIWTAPGSLDRWVKDMRVAGLPE